MFVALHFFRRDSRHLWWAIALTQVLLAGLTVADCWRADPQPGMFEGWGNILVPAAWAFLLAMAVSIDPLTGRQQFWATTPCSWSNLLGAKLLFALCWVHLPYLAGCAVIVAARGFAPWLFLPQLFAKQLLIAAAVTVPALTLAALVRNLSHFALCLVAAGGVAAFMVSSPAALASRLPGDETLRPILALVILGAGTAAALVLQFRLRRTTLGRALVVTALSATLALAALWPQHGTASIVSAVTHRNRPPVTVRMPAAPDAATLPSNMRGPRHPALRRVGLALPAEVAGIGDNELALLQQVSLAITSARGDRLTAEPFYVRDRTRLPPLLSAFAFAFDRRMPPWQMIDMDQSAFERFRGAPVHIQARLSASIHRRGAATELALHQRSNVPGAGRCFSEEREGPSFYRALAVVCESPDEPQSLTEVRLYQPGGGLDILHRLGTYGMVVSWPTSTWLSPVQRRHTYFQIADPPVPFTPDRWMVERRRLSNARLQITPVYQVSTQIVNYAASAVDLKRYVVPSAL